MTQLILYTSEDGQTQVQREATDKESLTVQTEGSYAASDHFRGVTKMVNNLRATP
jgi:hypothetical protein